VIVLGHAADFVSLIFIAPALAFIVWLVVAQVRQRRAGRSGEAE
jgi:hypothetical protein